jgi:hypothetical protein
MERFNALGRGAQIMLVAGVVLLIDLFLPWQDFGVSDVLGVDVDDSFSGWRGFAGVVLGLLTIVLLAWLVVRLLAVQIPLPISAALTSALLGGLVGAFGIIKLLTILGDEPTIWAWIGAILAIVVAVGAWLEVQAGGGVESLRGEVSTLQSSRQTAVAPAPPETTAPPVSEPEPPAAAPGIPGHAPPERAPEAPGEPERAQEPDEPYDPNAPRSA